MTELFPLKSPETYLPDVVFIINNVTDKYIQILVQYFNVAQKQKFIVSRPNILQFILMRGLDTITHVFKYILLYTRNLEAAFYHAERSIYYYLEFISQVTEQKNAFLQLSTKDAILYVYKKTIYLLDMAEYKQDIPPTINTYMQIYKNVADNAILVRKNESCLSTEDIEKLKTTILEINTGKKTTEEWVKYFKELNVMDD